MSQIRREDDTYVGQAHFPSNLRNRENETLRLEEHDIPDIKQSSDAQTGRDLDDIMTILVYIMLKDIRKRRGEKTLQTASLMVETLGLLGVVL